MTGTRGVLAAERRLGWLFSRGLSRGGAGEFDHDRLIDEACHGLDKIKAKVLGLNDAELRSSALLQQESDILLDQIGPRVWPGRGSPVKPAWVADASPTVCGGFYREDLCWHDPASREKLRSLFFHMVLSKARAFRQNQRQKGKTQHASTIDSSSIDLDQGSEPEFSIGQYDQRRSDSRASRSPSVASSGVRQMSHEFAAERSVPMADVRYAEDAYEFAADRAVLMRPPLDERVTACQDMLSTVAHERRRSDSHSNLSAEQISQLDRLLLQPLQPVPAAPASREGLLSLLQRIDLALQHPAFGQNVTVTVNLARCVTREALYQRIDQSLASLPKASASDSHHLRDSSHRHSGDNDFPKAEALQLQFDQDEDEVPSELQGMVLRRNGFRDQYPLFVQCMRRLDNGLDLYRILAVMRIAADNARGNDQI